MALETYQASSLGWVYIISTFQLQGSVIQDGHGQ
jgi:hypothetical protein